MVLRALRIVDSTLIGLNFRGYLPPATTGCAALMEIAFFAVEKTLDRLSTAESLNLNTSDIQPLSSQAPNFGGKT